MPNLKAASAALLMTLSSSQYCVATADEATKICDSCFEWNQTPVGLVARVWLSLVIDYEITGSNKDKDTETLRVLLDRLSFHTGLTFRQVNEAAHLVVYDDPNSFRLIQDALPEGSGLKPLTSNRAVVVGTIKHAFLAKQECASLSLNDSENRTRFGAIIVNNNASSCLETMLKGLFGLTNINRGNDYVNLCILYTTYRRFARTREEIIGLVESHALSCPPDFNTPK